eukprot:363911-Chlamydomonas_euryale.AAC.2
MSARPVMSMMLGVRCAAHGARLPCAPVPAQEGRMHTDCRGTGHACPNPGVKPTPAARAPTAAPRQTRHIHKAVTALLPRMSSPQRKLVANFTRTSRPQRCASQQGGPFAKCQSGCSPRRNAKVEFKPTANHNIANITMAAAMTTRREVNHKQW